MLNQHRPKILALVHAETSTGACQPLDGIAKACQETDTLFLLDTVTSLGGVSDGWWMMDDGWWMMDDGWWMMDDVMDDGWKKWVRDDGWWMVDDGLNNFFIALKKYINNSSSVFHHPPSTIHHPPSTIHHPSSIIHHPPTKLLVSPHHRVTH